MGDDYRLLIRALYAAVLSLSDSDWSVKALNAGLDVLNVLLVYAIGRRISRRPAALAAALSFALMPPRSPGEPVQACHERGYTPHAWPSG